MWTAHELLCVCARCLYCAFTLECFAQFTEMRRQVFIVKSKAPQNSEIAGKLKLKHRQNTRCHILYHLNVSNSSFLFESLLTKQKKQQQQQQHKRRARP